MALKDVANVADGGAPVQGRFLRVQRSRRDIAFVVPETGHVKRLPVEFGKVPVLAIYHAARGDASVRIDHDRPVQIETRAWLSRLPELLLLMITLHAPFNTGRIPFVGNLLAIPEFKWHSHGNEAQQVDTDFLGKDLGLTDLVLSLLHHDELPLDHRRFQPPRLPTAQK